MKKIIINVSIFVFCAISHANTQNMRIGIVGGGPAGLTAAHYLKKAGYANVIVMEKNFEVGGKTQTVEYNGHNYEMGAIMSGPSYEQVIKLSKEFGEKTVPFAKGSAPMVEADNQSAAMKQMTISKKIMLLAATVEYHFLYRKFNSAFSQPGMAKSPTELNEPFSTWAQKNSKFPDALTELLSYSFVSFGYGHMSEVPAAYVFRYFSPKLLRSFVFGQIHMLQNGYQSLWKKIAASVTVKLNFDVEKAHRDQYQWNVVSKSGEILQFDALVWTAPLEILGQKIEIAPHLKDIFSKIRYQNYYSTLVEVDGLSKGGGSVPDNFEKQTSTGHIVSWLHRWPQKTDIANFYSLSNENLSPEQVETEIKKFANQHNFKIRNIIKNISWHYFPHFDTEALDLQAYEIIESQQGNKGLYMAGELMNFSTVEHTSEYAKELVERFFIRQKKLITSLPKNYKQMDSKNKLQLIWNNILQSEYKINPSYKQFEGNVIKDLLGFFPVQLSKAFSNNTDIIEKDRDKIIHKLGSTALIQFESVDTKYQNFDGLIRLSNAVDSSGGTVYPSFSIKIPQDKNTNSINFNIGKSFDGQRIGNNFFKDGKPDYNFFRDDLIYPFSNELPNIAHSKLGQIFKKLFEFAHLAPNYISVGELTKVMNKPAPRRLIFRAPQEIQTLMPSDYFTDERQAFAKIKIGTVLFDVYESQGLSDQGRLVGRLRTTTRFVNSNFGDRNVYFRHESGSVKKNQPEFSNSID
jgi:hypothetical protein